MLMRSLAPTTRPPLILPAVLAAIADVAAARVRPVALTDFRKPRRSRGPFVDMRTPYSDGRCPAPPNRTLFTCLCKLGGADPLVRGRRPRRPAAVMRESEASGESGSRGSAPPLAPTAAPAALDR